MRVHRHPARGFTQAFTLIGLLVVIAVISILAAILFPVFMQAREKARQAACASNLKQVTTAYLMYLDDYDGLMMKRYEACGAMTPASDTNIWANTLQAYIQNRGAAFLRPFAANGEYGETWATRRLSASNLPMSACRRTVPTRASEEAAVSRRALTKAGAAGTLFGTCCRSRKEAQEQDE